MRSLSVLTWNIWFDSFEKAARYGGVIGIISSLNPDVVCLQEVTTSFIRLLKDSSLPSIYSISDNLTGSTIIPYGTLTLVKTELLATFRFVDFPSRMYRKLLTAEIPHPHGKIVVGNVHLESLSNHPTREAQLQICQKVFQPYPFFVLVGDFNFCSYRNYCPESSVLENDSLQRILPGSHDMWLDIHDPTVDPGYTFEGGVNPFIPNKKETMRYDRIVYHDQGCAKPWRAQSIEIIGNAPLTDGELTSSPTNPGSPPPQPRSKKILLGSDAVDLYPSDHYGLIGRFTLDT
ncbi:hypothetical protein EON65_21835 [archaeon]|nr:MAG: hypothetical protein EON65_21835 [archaeon]